MSLQQSAGRYFWVSEILPDILKVWISLRNLEISKKNETFKK